MSRAKRFAHSLATSYLLLGANMVYTLLSLPLALSYLGKKEFGLWIITSQIAGYMAMVDLGMNTSIARILIDKKDHRDDDHYGGAIKTGILVGLAQAGIILLVGIVIAAFLGTWLRVPEELSRKFFWLMLGQVVLTAGTFATRTFGQVLYAWQRMDIANYAQIAQTAVWLATLWIGFAWGLGVYSLLFSAAAGFVCVTVINAFACHRLDLWPRPGKWGRATGRQFREVFSYSADLFLIALGSQLILSSQTILVTRVLGMDTATVWTVMTKAFSLITQVIWRIIGNTMPAFAEMMARGETCRLWHRYRGLFITVTVLCGLGGVLFAASNSEFVHLWMHGTIGWPRINDGLLALWMLLLTQQCCHTSFIACLKEVREIKYTYLIEGAVFIGASLLVLPRWGLTGMLVCSVACSGLFTTANATWRIAKLAATNGQGPVWRWQLPLLRIWAVMVPCWLGLEFLLRGESVIVQLVILCSALGLLGVIVAIRFALPQALAAELSEKLPRPLQQMSALLVK